MSDESEGEVAQRRHVLVIAYHLPPAGGVPVRRALRVLRHLPSNGWRCSVVTAESPYDPYHPSDPSGVAAMPPIAHLLRTPTRSGIEAALAWLWRLRSRAAADRGQPAVAGDEVSGGQLRRLLQDYGLFPDPKRFWASSAFAPACDLARRDPVDLVWATGFPWSSFRLARDVARAIDRPYALDYRDAWTANPRRVWDSAKQRSLEAALFADASLVTAATDWIRDDLRARFTGDTPVETMTNAYDPAERPACDAGLSDPQRCVLTYTGTFNDGWPPAPGDQSPWWLFEAIEKLPMAVRQRLRVRLVGRVPAVVARTVAARGISDVVEVVPFVPHARSLQYQRASDHLILIVGDAPGSAGILTGKLVEYAGAGRPVLALVPEGEASRMVRRHGLGRVVAPRDVSAIQAELIRLVETWSSDGRPGEVPLPDALSVSAQVGALGGWLERAVQDRRA